MKTINAIKTSHILPGYSFELSNKKNFARKQNLKFKNGYDVVEENFIPISSEEIANIPHVKYDPVLMFGLLKKPTVEKFIPNYVKYDRLTLLFGGYIVPIYDKNSSFKNSSNHSEDNISRGHHSHIEETYQKDLRTKGKAYEYDFVNHEKSEESCENTRKESEKSLSTKGKTDEYYFANNEESCENTRKNSEKVSSTKGKTDEYYFVKNEESCENTREKSEKASSTNGKIDEYYFVNNEESCENTREKSEKSLSTKGKTYEHYFVNNESNEESCEDSQNKSEKASSRKGKTDEYYFVNNGMSEESCEDTRKKNEKALSTKGKTDEYYFVNNEESCENTRKRSEKSLSTKGKTYEHYFVNKEESCENNGMNNEKFLSTNEKPNEYYFVNNESNEESCEDHRKISKKLSRSKETNVEKSRHEEEGKTMQINENDKREIVLVYYLEDDTLKILEKSPISKHYETISKRAKLCKERDGPGIFYTWKDLNVDIDIHMKYFNIHITCCNEFTREFYKENFIDLNEDETAFYKKPRPTSKHYKSSLGGETIITCDQQH